jgi:hypothetical protein
MVPTGRIAIRRRLMDKDAFRQRLRGACRPLYIDSRSISSSFIIVLGSEKAVPILIVIVLQNMLGIPAIGNS